MSTNPQPSAQSRIAAAIREHARAGRVSIVNDNEYYRCRCGESPLTLKEHADHVAAAVLASLNLTAETQDRPVFNGNPCTCNRPDGKHYGMGCDYNRTDWIPHGRWVTPWEVSGE